MRYMCLFLAAALVPLPAPAADSTPDAVEEFFSAPAIEDVRLTFEPDGWETLKARYLENDWYKADFEWRSVTLRNVGVRSRGTGSRNPIKPGVRLEFGRYEAGQNFLGIPRLELKNAVQDPSMLKEHVSMRLYRLMGMPAPRTIHIRLFVNGEYAGLYTAVEPINTYFLRANFGDDTGFLYDYSWADPYFFEYLGPDPSLYVPSRFDPSTRAGDQDPAALVEMIRLTNEAPDEEFAERIGEYVDMDGFLRYAAIENYLADLDGVLGAFGMANFYVYRLDGSNQFHWIAWDKDRTFSDASRDIFHNFDQNALTRRAMQVPRFREAYLAALHATADTAGGIGGWLEWEILRAYFRVEDAAYADERKQCPPEEWLFEDPHACSFDEFHGAAARMAQFARERYGFVKDQANAAAR